MKKILVIGAAGTIGSAIVKELEIDTEILTAGFKSGTYQVDLGNNKSIEDLFHTIGSLDGIICAAARGVVFKPIEEMHLEDYIASAQQKLFGQIHVVLQGIKNLHDKGSITLTTGAFNRDFVENGSAASMVNSAIEGFVQAVSLGMPRGIRINVVSPSLLAESAEQYQKVCPGFNTVPASKVAKAYRRSIYGIQSGQVFQVN
ncbi:short chain dehydrogenase (plasmid) [Legionella adelaidensis]|uniref:Short chain dehydrogenase n=1 Tax=Legionella adelaidensis TaxID=45056 RepID=A0A0W0R3W9_9GAMM|nr:short chain dehydrogenase [Legionella adelaidensis]KTC65757.1 short chain dehydrogenase [Legionella adelaidensis]VEH85301.1 short chain dehydrogenase [Legionella adelaidensis]